MKTFAFRGAAEFERSPLVGAVRDVAREEPYASYYRELLAEFGFVELYILGTEPEYLEECYLCAGGEADPELDDDVEARGQIQPLSFSYRDDTGSIAFRPVFAETPDGALFWGCGNEMARLSEDRAREVRALTAEDRAKLAVEWWREYVDATVGDELFGYLREMGVPSVPEDWESANA